MAASAPLTKPADVSDAYAVPDEKRYSVGPIPDDECPQWDVVGPRTVMPARLPSGRWAPGGGTEAATSATLHLPGIRKLA